MINFGSSSGGAVAQLGARLDGIEEVVGSNPIGSTNFTFSVLLRTHPRCNPPPPLQVLLLEPHFLRSSRTCYDTSFAIAFSYSCSPSRVAVPCGRRSFDSSYDS